MIGLPGDFFTFNDYCFFIPESNAHDFAIEYYDLLSEIQRYLIKRLKDKL